MFIGSVLSEYDEESIENFKPTSVMWNYYSVKQLDGDFSCRKALEFPERKKSSLSGRQDIKPMMTKCSGSIKYDPDTGAITITAAAEFESSGKEVEKDNDSGRGTTAADTDPPDSRDRDVDRD